jgi:CHASE3 domain sensor protein
MKFRKANKILFWLGMSLPMLGLIAMSWLVHQTSGQFTNSFNWVIHTYKVLDVIEQTQAHIVDAEANRRGYLLTGREDYFSPYDAAMASVNDDLGQLKDLTGDNSLQQTNVSALEKIVGQRLALNYEEAMAERTNTPAVVLTQRGRETIYELHRVLFQMRQSEQHLLAQRQQETEADTLSSQLMSFILIGAVALTLIFIVLILLRLEKLQRFVTICAWTGQVKEDGKWVRVDEYLQRHLGMSISHGLSGEAAGKIIEELGGRDEKCGASPAETK